MSGLHRVIVLRHARTASNATATWQGQTDIPLDDVGLAQTVKMAQMLAEGPAPVRMVSSDLSRARQTAEPLAQAWGIELELDPRLREVDAGRWEGLARAAIAEQWPEELARWQAGEDLQIGGGERISEAGARGKACIEEVVESAEVSVVVGHGGSLRSSVQQLIGVGTDGRFLATLRNAHWGVLLRHPNGTWSIDAWNLGAEGLTLPVHTVM